MSEQPEFQYIPSVWPGTINTGGLQYPDGAVELPDSSPLTPEQDARASALYHARANLESKGGPMGPASQTRPPKVEDLLLAARWIVDGDSDGDS